MSLPFLIEDQKFGFWDYRFAFFVIENRYSVVAALNAERCFCIEQDTGAPFTSSVKVCRQHLIAMTANDGAALNAVNLSRVIVMMMNSCTGAPLQPPPMQASNLWDHRTGNVPALATGSSVENLSTTAATSSLSDSAANVPPGAASQPVQQISWNPRIFAAAVRELAPTLNWSEVIMHLDQTNFVVRNKPQLQLLTALLLEGLGSNSFPIGLLYREWNFHKLGQLSWIEQILLNTDVFCFADYPYKAVNLSVLKVQPEETRELSNWRCLDLVDTLVRLGELKKFMNIVLNILLRPVNLCPDVLLLALLQIQIPTSTLRMHLCQLLIPALIGSHPNAVAVL
ncbi:unnamed protein product, partial [Gongylonema pulchrum]|uniref:CCR4-NOT transcription complex subunit 1 n=1 Tax=Gongylonema pulchrum TaxID=637853 RepID=A0A183D1W0_9BILA